MKASSQRSRLAAFSLLEMMIAVFIVGILATVAVTTYRSYLLRSNRALVRGLLVDLAAKQEVEALKSGRYAGNLDFYLASGTAPSRFFVTRQGMTQTSSDSLSIYRIDLSGATATSFTLTATAVNGQAADSACASLTLDSKGLRTSTPGSDCWTR